MNTHDLRSLTEHDGPFASVYIDTINDTEDAAHQQQLRVRSVREQLAEAGAPDAMLTAVEQGLADPPPGRAGQAVIADAEQVLLAEPLPVGPARSMVRLSGLPYLLPLLRLRPSGPPHVVVLVDERGADIYGVDADGLRIADETEGIQHPVHKVRGGGPAHRSMQNRVEETIHRNIDDAAREVVGLAERVDATLIIVAGDIEPRSALADELAAHQREIVQVAGVTRAAEHDRADLDQRVHEVLDERIRAHTGELLDRFAQERAHELAVDGLGATAAALSQHNIETLLVDPDVLADRTVYVGADPSLIQADLPSGPSGSTITSRPADEALPVAALVSAAEVVTAEGHALTDGVGGLLRHR